MPSLVHDAAQTLLKRTREHRAHDAHRAGEIRAKLSAEVAELEQTGAIQRCWLIGSLAWGGFGPRSDVDVVVEGLDPEIATDIWDRLGERLGTSVDLLRIEDLPEAFRRRIEREGIPLVPVPPPG